ncbi:hypothetical protein ACFX14_038716 [Malus domestica]
MLKSSFAPIFSTFPAKSLSPPNPPPHTTFHLFRTHRANCSTICLNQNPAIILPPPTSAYIHLPFCPKRCFHPIVAFGAASPQAEDDPRMTNYVRLLCREINATKAENKTGPPLDTVFFACGTPPLVPPKLVDSVLETLRFSSEAQVSMEMDPATFDAKKMKGLMELGVNRVSLGVQAFQEELLKACGPQVVGELMEFGRFVRLWRLLGNVGLRIGAWILSLLCLTRPGKCGRRA